MRAANSIAHVGSYVTEKLPEFLAFDNISDSLKMRKGENSLELVQFKETLQKLMAATKEVTIRSKLFLTLLNMNKLLDH